MKKLKYILTICGLWIAASVSAQTDSLSTYLLLAARNNPKVIQAYRQYRASLQKVPQVGSLPDPQLSVGIFLSPMELIGGKQYANLQLMQMFPWFGTLRAAKDEMSLMAKAKYEAMEDAKQQTFLALQQAWYELYKVEQNIRISKQNLELLKRTEQLALVRFQAPATGSTYTSSAKTSTRAMSQSSKAQATTSGGSMGMSGAAAAPSQPAPMAKSSGSMGGGSSMGSSTGGSGLADLYRIKIDMAELDNSIASLQSKKRTLTAKFNAYLNREAEATVWLPDSLSVEPYPLPEVTDSLFANNPMLNMIRYDNQAVDARKRMIRKMGYPMVGLGVSYSVIGKSNMSTSAMNGDDMIMPMVNLTLPIYRGKYKAMREEADWNHQANDAAYTATLNDLRTGYYEAREALDDAQRRIGLYADQSRLTEQTLNLLIKSFEASGASLTDILGVRRQLLTYRIGQIEAMADYNTSVAWIKRILCN